MFSGIIEEFATVTNIQKDKDNINFTLSCSFVDELDIDQSVAHNGVCLTVVKLEQDCYTVTAMKETLMRSNLGMLKIGDKVNVERSMQMNGRLDGHIVQGHVDGTARCTAKDDANGSTYFTFEYVYEPELAHKGEGEILFLRLLDVPITIHLSRTSERVIPYPSSLIVIRLP